MSDDERKLLREMDAPERPPPLVIEYRNWRGVTAVRRVIPASTYYGESPYHPGPQWLMDALCLDSGKVKTFALAGIVRVVDATGGEVSHDGA